jgi:hypothetical protein
MISRILFFFMLFASLAYYFDIDVRAVVDKSGVPTWLAAHGIATHAASSTAAVASVDPDAP